MVELSFTAMAELQPPQKGRRTVTPSRHALNSNWMDGDPVHAILMQILTNKQKKTQTLARIFHLELHDVVRQNIAPGSVVNPSLQ